MTAPVEGDAAAMHGNGGNGDQGKPPRSLPELAAELATELAPIAWLVGTWEGEGEGTYPTTGSFRYRERTVFSATPKPYLAYRQQCWDAVDGRPMHAETGFWRVSDGIVEAMIAHPFGICEIAVGRTGPEGMIVLEAALGLEAGRGLIGTHSAKRVDAVARRYTPVEPGPDGTTSRCAVSLAMAALGLPLQAHLSAALHRIDP